MSDRPKLKYRVDRRRIDQRTRDRRNASIVEMHKSRISISAISRNFGLNREMIRRIIRMSVTG